MSEKWLEKNELSGILAATNINGGNQFEPGDGINADDINNIVHHVLNSYYLVSDNAINWRGVYSNTESYYKNDLVYYGGSIYLATDITTGAPIPPNLLDSNLSTVDTNKWRIFTISGKDGANGRDGSTGPQGPLGARGEVGPRGISFRVSKWEAGREYRNDENDANGGNIDIVTYNGNAYIVCLRHFASTNLTPHDDVLYAENNPSDINYYPTYELFVSKGDPSRGYVFDTVAQLNNWLSGSYTRSDGAIKADLNIGDNLWIVDTQVPDYWWDGFQKRELEVKVVDPATISSAGLMSASDKIKLNGISNGAQVNSIETIKLNNSILPVNGKEVNIPVDSAVSSSSMNPVQSKAVYNAINNLNISGALNSKLKIGNDEYTLRTAPQGDVGIDNHITFVMESTVPGKVKDIIIGDSTFSPSRWTTLWSGEEELYDPENIYSDGDFVFAIPGLSASKPTKIVADLYVESWESTNQSYPDVYMLDEGVKHSLTIDTSNKVSNVPDEVLETVGRYDDVPHNICFAENEIIASYTVAAYCHGTTTGRAFWILKEVAQYN